jgi:hypothetical protein
VASRLSIEQVLAWADAHRERTGTWPTIKSGPVVDAPGETWLAINSAMQTGGRGFPRHAKLTLVRLLAKYRGVRNPMALPPLSTEQILAWTDAHHERTGRWPSQLSGPIPESSGETWLRVDWALRAGSRGVPGSSSLARMLELHRSISRARRFVRQPPLSNEQILAWADLHFQRTGRWPTAKTGDVIGASRET